MLRRLSFTAGRVRTGLLSVLLAGAASCLFADRLVLKNGRTLECVVEEQTPSLVRVRVASGELVFPQNLIQRVETESDSKNETIRYQWEQAAEKRRKLSSGLAGELSRKFEELRRMQVEAMSAQQKNDAVAGAQRKAELKIQRVASDLQNLSSRLSEIQARNDAIQLPKLNSSSPSQVRSYNRILSSKNDLQHQAFSLISTIQQKQVAIEDARKSIDRLFEDSRASSETISRYLEFLSEFSDWFDDHEKKKELKRLPEVEALVKRVRRQLDKFKEQVFSTPISVRRDGNTWLVSTRINGAATGEFIFDTGATSMSLYESFARKAGVSTAGAPSVVVETAGGRVMGRRVMLDSVQVGEEIVRRVPCVVIPDGTSREHDGLLGMSFLSHFNINFQGNGREIELIRLGSQ